MSNENITVTDEAKDYFFKNWGKALFLGETGKVIKKFCRLIGSDPATAYLEVKEVIKTYESNH